MPVYQALTIAGSDSGGGAGIQADLKTFQELGVYGMSAITAVTAQNTLGVHGVYPLDAGAVRQQLDAIGTDLAPGAVKTGMLFSEEVIRVVAEAIQQYGWDQLVIDPVMIAKGGASLLQPSAGDAMRRLLLPLAFVVTPNLPEAEQLCEMKIVTLSDREEAAKRLVQMGARHVVLKGGHDAETSGSVIDVLYDGTEFVYLEGSRIETRHTHGTGCTFSAAITAGLARGEDILEAMRTAKAFIQAAIEDGLGIGGGHGPTNHFAYQRRKREVHYGISE